MKQLTVLFSKPLVLPTDEGDRISTYGLYLDKTDKATFYNITEYVLNYLCVISQLYKDNVKRVSDYVYEKDGQEIVIWDSTWEKYAEKAAQGGLSVAGRCRCLTKDSNTSIEKEGYIPYSLQA